MMIGWGVMGLALLILVGVTWLATRLIFPPGREAANPAAGRAPGPDAVPAAPRAGNPFASGHPVTGASAPPWSVPGAAPQPAQFPAAGAPVFDQEAFLRDAKILFVRMQGAYDRQELNDIRQFTTPAVFAEISRQCQARGDAISRTDVVALQAELLDLNEAPDAWTVRIRFSGMVHEDSALLAHPFAEIWRLTRPSDGQSTWRIAGVEQQPAS